MATDSVHLMWHSYLSTLGETPETATQPLSSWHFCDNAADANECAELVRQGIKTATAPSLWYFEVRNEPIPQPGDLHVITDWKGEAQCIICTTRVEVVPFDEVTAEHAAAEGEGDRSLEFWRRVHWEYYHRELEGSPLAPQDDMPIVCERFEVVYPAPGISST